jgi:hypothetical protein
MNGWKNYETWNLALWLTNDEGMNRSMSSMLVGLGAAPSKDGSRRTKVTETEALSISIVAVGRRTPDGVSLLDPQIAWGEVARMMEEHLP